MHILVGPLQGIETSMQSLFIFSHRCFPVQVRRCQQKWTIPLKNRTPLWKTILGVQGGGLEIRRCPGRYLAGGGVNALPVPERGWRVGWVGEEGRDG